MTTTKAQTAPVAPSGPATQLLNLPLGLARRVLPDSSTPVLLGASALALAGLIEWPVVGAAGLGYLALRRWHPTS